MSTRLATITIDQGKDEALDVKFEPRPNLGPEHLTQLRDALRKLEDHVLSQLLEHLASIAIHTSHAKSLGEGQRRRSAS